MKHLSGTYKGLGKSVEIILRLDIDGPVALNMLSGELNQSLLLREFNYFNLRRHSFIGDDITRTENGNRILLKTPIRFFRLPDLMGLIEVEIQPTSTVARIKLTGYGYHRQPLTFALEKTSDFFRTVRLEIDLEKGTEYPGPYHPWKHMPENVPADMPRPPVSIQSVFQHAGVEVIVNPRHTMIPTSSVGPDAAWNTAELHAAMMKYFSLISKDPTWNVYLLVGEKYVNPGVSGIMFDTTDPLPRQGAAIFYSHYRNLPEGIKERNFLRTAVHELGHALNVMHSFQKGVFSELGMGDNPFMMPRSDSLSMMNYPWRYPYGHNMPQGWNGTEDYWARHVFEFDDIELMHMRHHDRMEVIFGGEAFGIHGHSRVPSFEPPEIKTTNEQSALKLDLRGKRVRDIDVRTFELMEPVHLELKVESRSQESEEFIKSLDVSDGVVAIYIQRPTGEVVKFRPLMTTCYDAPQLGVIRPGLPYYQNLHLTFGKDGFYFQEPGVYLIRAVYLGGERLTAYSDVLAIRIAAPKTAEQEQLAAEFFEPVTGHLLAVGPSDSAQFSGKIGFLQDAAEKMAETATGRALSAYVGMVKGMRFKDISYEDVSENGFPRREVKFTLTNAETEEGKTYLNKALEPGKTYDELSNLVRYDMGLNWARMLESAGDLDGARQAIDVLKEQVSASIGNPVLREREMKNLDTEKMSIGARVKAEA